MLKLKRVMGNAVRCRIDAEYMVSRYEIGVLQIHPVKGLLKVQFDKTGDLIWSGKGKRTLTQRLLQKMGQQQLTVVMRSALETVCEIRQLGLDEHRLLLHPDWIFTDEDGKAYFIYFPVNGIGRGYDFSLFCRDIILSAELTESERRLWKRWTDELSREGVHGRSMEHFLSLFQVPHADGRWNDAQTIMDEEGASSQDGLERTVYDTAEERDVDCEATEDAVWKDDGDTLVDDDDLDGTLMDSYGSDTVQMHLPVLRRLSTGEERTISGDSFKIGRSAGRADFCITGNHCISNVHAIIVCIGDAYYIKDNYSTNGTSVDGVQVQAGGEPRLLTDGCRIRMWDEDFEFRL